MPSKSGWRVRSSTAPGMSVHSSIARRRSIGCCSRTHPMVIIGGILQENPFFVPSDEFLRELRERAGQNSAGVG